MLARLTRRSTTTSMVCISYRARLTSARSASSSGTPSTRTRAKPCLARSSSRELYSPLRPRTTGRHDLEAGALGQLEHPVDDLLGGLARHGPPADRAVGMADAGIQKAQVVVDLGDGADGRARVAGGRLLVDGDGRRQALDEVDVGLVHLAQELAGVGREGLDVAALALGVDGVEGQGGLPRARQAGEDDQLVPGQVERDIAQIVLTSPANDETVGHLWRIPVGCVTSRWAQVTASGGPPGCRRSRTGGGHCPTAVRTDASDGGRCRSHADDGLVQRRAAGGSLKAASP